jgi:hypothetical protein
MEFDETIGVRIKNKNKNNKKKTDKLGGDMSWVSFVYKYYELCTR